MKKRRKICFILILSTFIVLSIPRMVTLISVYRKLHWYQREITRLKDENKPLLHGKNAQREFWDDKKGRDSL